MKKLRIWIGLFALRFKTVFDFRTVILSLDDPDTKQCRWDLAFETNNDDILAQLATDSDIEVRAVVAQRSTRQSTLKLLAEDSCEKIRNYAKENLGTVWTVGISQVKPSTTNGVNFPKK